MATFMRSRARLMVLFMALCLPLLVAEVPAEAQSSGVSARRARRARAMRAQRVRARHQAVRQQRAERVRARRERIAATGAARRGEQVHRGEEAPAADMDFTAEASITPEAEHEAPPAMDMSYVAETEARREQDRLDALDPELRAGGDDEVELPPGMAAAGGPRERGRHTPVVARLGVGGMNRGLRYSGYERGALTDYALPVGASLGLGVDWFPGAHLTNDALAHLGFAWRFQNSLGVESLGPNDVAYPTNAYAWQVGARYRVVLDDAGSELTGELDVGQQGFHVDRGALENPAPEGVPGVDYTFVRIGASGRWDLGDVALGLRGAYLPVLDAGPLAAALGGAEVHGFEAGASFGYHLGLGFSVLAEVDTRVYTLGFAPAEDAPIVASGALDHTVTFAVGIEYRMPAGL